MKIKFASRSTLAFAALTFSLSCFTACDDTSSANEEFNTPQISSQAGTSSSAQEMNSKSSDSADSERTLADSENLSGEDSLSLHTTNTSADTESSQHTSHHFHSSSSVIASSNASTISNASSANPQSSSTISISSQASNTQVSLDENGFATVADVYKSLAPSEKAVFVIRHSERENSVTIETELTANGIKMAEDLGASLKSEEDFTYITSGFVRTNETANHIAAGRGTPSPKLITNYDITGNWFLKISADELATYADNLGMKGSSVELMSHWAYGEAYPDALYELEPRAKEFMETVILKNLPKWNRISIMVSHDIFVMPLAVYGSQKKVALKYYEDYHWINYIAGLAIIVNENNELRFVPVKGTDSGVVDYLAIYMAEHNMKF